MNLYEIFGYPLFLIAGLQVYLGSLILRHNPRNSPLNRSVALFAFLSAAYVLSNAAAYIRASLGQDFGLFFRTAWIGWLSIPAALQFLYYLREDSSRMARIIGFILYPFWTIVLILTITTDLIEPGDQSLIPYINRKGPLEDPLRALGSAMIFWVFIEVIRLRRRISGARKAQLNYFFYGTLIFAAGGILVVGLAQIFGDWGVSPALGAYFSLPWVALTFYAITRYRLFDIKVVISGALSVIILSALFFVLAWSLFELLRPVTGTFAGILIVSPIMGFLFLGTPITKGLNLWIERLIVKNKYDYQIMLKRAMKEIISILDLNDLLSYIIATIQKGFQADQVRLFLQNEEEYGVSKTARLDEEIPIGVLSVLKNSGRALLRQEIEIMQPDAELGTAEAFFDRTGYNLLVPLLFKGDLKAVLAIGKKIGGEPYIESDIELLDDLARYAAAALENSRLYKEAVRTRQSLLLSEARFRTLAETTPSAIFMLKNGEFIYANPAAEELSGYTADELSRTRLEEIIHPAFREIVHSLTPGRLTEKEGIAQYEFKLIRKNGDERWVLMTSGVIDHYGGGAVISTMFDITERVALEGRLRNVQKMEAIGKLAAGVAHDFNNILTTIVGHGALLQMKIHGSDPLRNHIDQIMAASERAADLTQTLLSFGRKKEVNLTAQDMNDILRGMKSLLPGMLAGNIRLQVRLSQEALPVAADRGQMDRVIMNLVSNAKDAMPAGGALVISTRVITVDDDFIKVHGYVKKGQYAAMTVSDSGMGMDENTKAKIFEPFFTTKKEGKGTGFGLAIVYDIIKLHNGYITVESEPGKGTSFLVLLPLSGHAVRHPQPVYEQPSLEGGETLLVADDDEMSRGQICSVLISCGYSVIEAVDGEEALAKFRLHEKEVSLILLDVMMPKMNGMDTFEAIKKVRPDAKAIFMSGYTEDILLEKGLLSAGSKCVLKPIGPRVLLQSVRDALDSGV